MWNIGHSSRLHFLSTTLDGMCEGSNLSNYFSLTSSFSLATFTPAWANHLIKSMWVYGNCCGLLPFHCSYLLPWQAQICLQGKSCECRDFNFEVQVRHKNFLVSRSLWSDFCLQLYQARPVLTIFLQALSSPLLRRRVLILASLELTDGFTKSLGANPAHGFQEFPMIFH